MNDDRVKNIENDRSGPVRPRPRSHAERSAATRQAVLDAALRLLNSRGYSGATIAAIREEAGVSTGALNHQFPSKAQLMAAIVEKFCADRTAAYVEAMKFAKSPVDIVKAVVKTTNQITQLPEMTAINEIHLARRNDRELDELTEPFYVQFNQNLRQWLDTARRAGELESDRRFDAFILLIFAMYRGLTMEIAGNTDKNSIQDAMTLWGDLTMQFLFPVKLE